ncbi:hypothetical protein [Muricoccus vinaceus]|uniref:Uncharacterized protein n=1 Tax=Muricoccus vinaceus TaxID=424704 RepID=A0ABV6IYU4_9PROT
MPIEPMRGPEAGPGEGSACSVHGAVPVSLAETRLSPPIRIAGLEEDEDPRGEWWALLRAVAIGVVAIMLIGWLISR